MILLKPGFFVFLISCLIAIFIAGCEFDDPYVPDYAGSSTLAGRIITEPSMDLKGTEVYLRGRDSFACITDPDGTFHFQDIPPGDYSIQMQKKPYLQDSFPVTISKSADEDTGDLKVTLKGAIAGTIPDNKLAILQGEVELVVYVDGVPLTLQQGNGSDLTIDLSSAESNINIRATTRITVYVDNIPYSAIVQDDGQFLVEFVPPGIYHDVQIRLNTKGTVIPITTGSPVVVKSGQTRVLVPTSSTSY